MEEYKIYYFGKSKLNNHNLLEQINWSYDLFEKCMEQINTNIPALIYLENLETNDYIMIAKLFLKLKEEGKIYTNLTIYNKTIDAHNTIFQLPIFKKVLNIFPFDKIITICDNNIYEAVKYINKSISVIFDPSKPQNKCFSIIQTKEQNGGNENKYKTNFEQIFIFRIMETNNEVELENTWWYKYYFSIPPCAYGRLAQSTGTCWLNTVLNILFLTEPIKQMLLEKYKMLDKELIKQVEQISEFSHLAAKDFPLQVILWAMVRLILIQRKKALTLDGDFMLIIGAKVKSLHEFGNENYWSENNIGLDYGNGYNDVKAISAILSLILVNTQDYFISFWFWSLNYNTRTQIQKDIDEYDELKDKFDDSTRDQFIKLENSLYSLNNLVNNFDYLIRKMEEGNDLLTLKWSDITVKNDHYNLFTNFNSSNPPKILIIPTIEAQIKNIPGIIYIDDAEYKLNAMSIVFYFKELNSDHVVSGLICGSKYYIYDSNGILTYDSWNKSVYNNYIDALNDFYKVNGFAYEYAQSFLLYIKT